MIKKNHKLGIIIPYRNRYEQLEEFKKTITEYLSKTDIDYEIIIVEQDNAKLFNRGMLLNIGFTYAKRLRCDYVIFHDVDMLPIDVDYSYSDIPLHLATDFIIEDGEKNREIFDGYFGGVTLFSVRDFEKIDGYSNKYWGWGYEDDDLLLRCKKQNLPLKIKKFNWLGKETYLKLNGVDACVKTKNIIDLKNSFTISISFCPDNIILDHTKASDEFTIFSIPGYDFAISYTSFNRYNFCIFDSARNAVYLNSDIKPPYKTNITIVYNAFDKKIKMYQDANFIGETTEIKRIYTNYQKEEFIYLGVGSPNREKIPNWFKGYFKNFIYYDRVLNETEILAINKNKKISKENLQIHYDAEHIDNYQLKDLSGNNNIGIIKNAEIVKTNEKEFVNIEMPRRRKSIFKSLKHEENGFLGNRWKDDNTRWNQLRFVNEVSGNDELLKNDGLSTLQFVEHGVNNIDKNIKLINIGI